MTTPTIAAPRSGYDRHKNTRSGFELFAWLFMRLSGVVLIVLIFGHLFVNLWLGEGVRAIDFGFVGGKWANPFWQVWDLIMLWLAMLHGTNGMRTIISDYAEKNSTRMWLKLALFIAAGVIIVLGTLVIFTFDPCPSGADPSIVADFCKAA